MTFYPQPNSYECGPFALKHALSMVGVFAHERFLAALAGSTTDGTDERQLARAAGRLGYALPTLRVTDPDAARRALAREVREGHPVLTCVDQWQHWIAVAAREGDRFVILDSAEPSVFRVVEWNELCERWGFRRGAGHGTRRLFDLNPLVPRTRRYARARLTASRVRYLQNGGSVLARDWSVYARDFLEFGAIARGVEDDPAVLPVAWLLERNRRGLLDRVDGRGPSYREAASRVLDRISFITDAYDVRVLPRHRREAVQCAESLMRTVSGIRQVGSSDR
ncbi:MAG: BtrH N-terminal domain-containing protein [Gemmatimonadota bacterium]|nr:BtrH N-terminal domain-containing protein [Gemmatimonadota bacterium]MDH3478739.1 BtrH N-terminal domain-containing protein [Gemmatimonadota bacterium]MDH3571227.1 BtrH N-terminal domain-containing protein [Gemmatimonadota bacterium]MDH5551608.1 BtrH N-terminal domain-containing protein [Gemmatimonadota bacterium]